jgi:hypothetical protein
VVQETNLAAPQFAPSTPACPMVSARSEPGRLVTVGIRNQPLRIVVVVGLWAMWVLWTITRFTSTVIATMPASSTCPKFQGCATSAAVAVQRQFSWSWWHFILTVIGAGLLFAASVMILRTPRSVDEL